MDGAGALLASAGRVAASGSAIRRASGSSACASGRALWRPVAALGGAPRSGARRADVAPSRGSSAVSAVAAGGGERRARGDGTGPARRSRASLANGDGARASSRGSSPRDTSPAGEDRRAPRRGAGAPGASRASVPGDDVDAAPRSLASSRDAGGARVALAADGRDASPASSARGDATPATPAETAPAARRRARDLARGSRDENETEGRAAAATARLRSGAMKSPVATAALSSVRVAREARAPSTTRSATGRSANARSSAATSASTRARAATSSAASTSSSASSSASSRSTGGAPPGSPSPRSPAPSPSPSPGSFAELRREASSILRALDAARAAPGGLRETLGSDPTTVYRLVDALCAAGMLPQACAFVREVVEADARAPPEAIATLVRHGARAGMPDEVRVAFEEYVRAGGRPTLRAYTDVVSGLTKAEARRSARGKAGGDVARESDAASNFASATDTAAISAWKSLVAASREDASLIPDGAAYTAAVAAYLSAGRAEEADRLVREMTRANVAAGPRLYNVLIAARGRAGDARGVRAAEAQMRAAGVRPNAATHGARVSAYARCGELDLAERALRAGMRAADPASKPTVRAYTAMVQGLASAGRADEARGWLREMREAGCEPNAHTYTAIVDGLARAGNPEGAEAMVDAMRADGVAPTAVTFNALLKGYIRRGRGKGGEKGGGEGSAEGASSGASSSGASSSGASSSSSNLDEARRVLEAMRAAGVDATVVTYNTLIDACAEAGEPTEAMFRVLSALVAAGHRPDVVTYTTLLKHFSREGDVVAARWLMREMEGDAAATPDAPAFNALVDALCRAGLTEEAAATLSRMRAGGCAPDVGTYGALMDGFAREADWASAASLYAALERRGEDPEGRGWRINADSDAEVFDEVESSAPGPDARMRAALAVACGRAGGAVAGATAERLIASVAASADEGAAAEAAELRERYRRELAGSGAYRGRTTVLDKNKKKKRRQPNANAAESDANPNPSGMDAVAAAAADRRAGCPIPGPAPSPSPSASASASASNAALDESSAGVTRGFEMWKHWLGLPSQYYAGEVGAAPPPTVAESAESARAEAEATGSNPAVAEERKYTKEEIAEAVRVLRAAAARRFPDDPETALRLALEAAEEGDARRLRE